MPNPTNPAYNPELDGQYRKLGAALQFELTVQGMRQTEAGRLAFNIATEFGVPTKAKATTLSSMLNTLLNGRFVEMLKYAEDPRLPGALKLEQLTAERLAVLFAALGVSLDDFSDRFLIDIPESLESALGRLDDIRYGDLQGESYIVTPEVEPEVDASVAALIEENDAIWVDDQVEDANYTPAPNLWQRVRDWFSGDAAVRA